MMAASAWSSSSALLRPNPWSMSAAMPRPSASTVLAAIVAAQIAPSTCQR